MKDHAKYPEAKAREALEALEQAYAYYMPEPVYVTPNKPQLPETPFVNYYEAA